MAPAPDVSVVVVTLNALPWVEQCLESVRGHDVVVVDHGSTDGTLELVRGRFPDVRILEQENRGMGGGNNAGMRVGSGRYWFLLNPDAWVVGDGLERLVAFADAHPEAAVVGPRLSNTDGTLQRSARAEPTVWRLTTEYAGVRKLAPGSSVLNPLYLGGFDHGTVREVDWLSGAALLVRRAAADDVGLFDESFFMFSEEVDWLTRFRRAGWSVLFYPAAEVVHVGGASHGGRMYVENLRGQLRFLDKHRGRDEAERARRVLLWSLRIRGLVFHGARGATYRDGAQFLASGDVDALLGEAASR
jgi:N-acetylglucosaminyl-diphospho-decaprenol L-rhamnosyltransferase